jgi:hypothetical protein
VYIFVGVVIVIEVSGSIEMRPKMMQKVIAAIVRFLDGVMDALSLPCNCYAFPE